MEIILVAVIFYGGGYLLIKWLNNSYDKHGSLMYPKEKEEGKSYSMQSDTSKDQNYPSNTTIVDTNSSDHLKNSDYTSLGSHTNNDTYLTNKINEAVVHKRAGEYGKAVAVYSYLSNQFPKHPGILKSWAKILVCQNKYEDAILKFRKAASLYTELGNESEVWQCNDQISTVKNRFNNQDDFIQYYRAVSGQRNAIPQLIDKKADSDKSTLIQSKTMEKHFDKLLQKYSLIQIDEPPPDLSFIKQKSYRLYRQCEGLKNDAINQSAIALRDCVWRFGDKDHGVDQSEINWWRENGFQVELNLMNSWWLREDETLIGNTQYLHELPYSEWVHLNFYTIGTLISENTASQYQHIAIDALKITLRIKKNYFQCYLRIGDCLVKQDKFEEAIPYYKTALYNRDSDHSYDAWCYLGIGICLTKIGDVENGHSIIKMANKVAKENFTAFRLFGYNDWDSVYRDLDILVD